MRRSALPRLLSSLPRGQAGLTLVELLVVLALLGVVLGGVYQYFSYGHASWERAAAESRAVQDARLAVARLDREVRQARRATESAGAVTVSSDQTELDIYTDEDGDGKPELVRWRMRDGVLERGVAAPAGDAYPYSYGTPGGWETVAARIVNGTGEPPFTLDSTYAPRLMVRVDLVVDDAETPLARPVRVQADLAVRSRGDAE